ncbi:hypothetical protein [Pseudomonas nitroreducens]|nr:hypothetical protein [Pseudomonas nitritireducens]
MPQTLPWVWRIRIRWEGDESECIHLCARTDLDGFIYTEPSGMYFNLASEHSGPESALAAGRQELLQLNGIAVIERVRGSWTLAGLEQSRNEGPPTSYLCPKGIEGTAYGRPTICARGPDGTVTPPLPQLYRRSTKENQYFAKALRLLSTLQADDWATLFNVTELVQTVGRTTLKSWGVIEHFDRIGSVANNASASGDKSRHAIQRHAKQVEPMDFGLAKEQVVSAVKRWGRHLEQDELADEES